MKKVTPLLIIFSLLMIFYSPKKSKIYQNIKTINFPNDNPIEKKLWLKSRLVDPATGEIPHGIRKKEVKFANSLPNDASNIFSLQWTARGPYNVGGRSRALTIDINDENIMLWQEVLTGGLWRSIRWGCYSWNKGDKAP